MDIWKKQRIKNLVEGNNIFISQIMGERGGYSEQNEDLHKGKRSCKVNEGVYFGESCN